MLLNRLKNKGHVLKKTRLKISSFGAIRLSVLDLIIYEPAWEQRERKKRARDGNKVCFIAGGLTSPKI